MPYGKKLSRQMARYLGLDGANESLRAALAPLLQNPPRDLPSAILGMLEKLPSFLEIVDASYEKYDENLAIAERNIALSSQELMQANKSIGTLVNSLGQGFLMFDESLICAPVYSRACETLLETVPAGKSIAAVLRLGEAKAERFSALLRLVFRDDHAVSFDEILRFAPNSFAHSGGRHIRLDYKGEQDHTGKIAQIVMIATDVTELERAEALAEERKVTFESIEHALRDRASFGFYIRRACDFIERLRQPAAKTTLTALAMEAHTLKAGAGMFRMQPLMNTFHDFESALKAAPEDASADRLAPAVFAHHAAALEKEITVIADRFRELLDIDILKIGAESAFNKAAIHNFAATLAQRGLLDIRRDYIRAVCAEPLEITLRPFDSYLAELAQRFNKKLHPLLISGGDIPIAPDRYRPLFQSFIHLFRNIMDHGVELPALRREAGKDEAARIKIAAALRDAATGEPWLRLEISDDGAGIDIGGIRKKLAAANPASRAATLTDSEVLQSMFSHNVSTRDTVTDLSGRGFGIRAVAEEVKKFGGTIEAKTERGRNTTFIIEVPYLFDL